MPEYFVLLLTQVTVFSSITAALLLLIKWIFRRRIPPILSMMLWLVLLARVLFPVLPESSFSIFNYIPVGRELMFTLTHDQDFEGQTHTAPTTAENPYEFQPAENSGAMAQFRGMSSEQEKASADDVNTAVNWKHHASIVLLSVFAMGVLGFGGFQLVMYGRSLRNVKLHSSPCFDNELQQLLVSTAKSLGIPEKRVPELRLGSTTMLAGLLHPCVILDSKQGRRRERNAQVYPVVPAELPLTAAEYRMIFAHELNHCKHLDNWILMLSTVMCSFFWFNPLLWYVRKMLREDIELLCDARTLEKCELGPREYAKLLCRSSYLEEAAEAGSAMSTCGRQLKSRLLHISESRKGRFLPRTVSFILCFAIIAVCLTNPIVSAESEYAAYISSCAAITGVEEKEFYLDENVSIYRFLKQFAEIMEHIGGGELRNAVGNGSLENLKRLVKASPYVDEEIADAVQKLRPSQVLDMESCVLLLSCMVGLIGEGRVVEEAPLLPEVLSVDTMDALCRNLSAEEGELLRACYNQGVSGANVEFEYIYTNAMMELIAERLNDDWAKMKILGYYREVNISPDKLDEISGYLNETIRYVGVGKDFYLCDPTITEPEEKILRAILGAAVAGQREDVYYLKDSEVGCSYEAAEFLFAKAGLTVAEMYAEYAQLGMTAYEYITPGEYGLISEYDLLDFANRLDDGNLLDQFRESLTYYQSYTYTGEDGTEITMPFRYYTVEEEAGQELMSSVLYRLNAAAFPLLSPDKSVAVTGTLSVGAKKAALEAVELGFVEPTEGELSLQTRVTSGKCAQILCRFMASMTNING